jgi:hypothetical protein
MTWLEAVWAAEIHRETYIAILDSWIPHGKRGNFASKVGIRREYLSYLCALDHPTEGKYPIRRLPSPQLAEKMAAVLPAPPEVRQSLLENMMLAHIHAARAYYSVKGETSRLSVKEKLSELEKIHEEATFGDDPVHVKRAYRVVRDASVNLLQQLSPEIYPISYARVCLYLHDAQNILDRADDALRFAKLARLILENEDISEPTFSSEQIDDLLINAIRCEAVAYHNLGLDRQTPAIFAKVEATSAYQRMKARWEPFIGRDMLNAMSLIPRYSIREAQKIAHKIISINEHRNDGLSLLMARESWARCLIQQGKLKQAERIFTEENERLHLLPQAGFLHRALLFKTGAHIAWEMKDLDLWKERTREALSLMVRSGLSHQSRLAREAFGAALDPILNDLNTR